MKRVVFLANASITRGDARLPCITPLVSCSSRFCGLMLTESTGRSTLVIWVYMSSLSNPSAYTDYLNTLGELEVFITAHQCDDTLIVGVFNVDFNRQGPRKQLVLDFMVDLDLVACDLSFQDSVGFTYERDDSSARSWIDHILSSQSLHSHLSNVHNITLPSLTAPSGGVLYNNNTVITQFGS